MMRCAKIRLFSRETAHVDVEPPGQGAESGARIRTRGENRMTGTTKHSPRTELVELVAVSQSALGEGLLSSPLASLSLLSLSSASRSRCSLPSRKPVRLPQAWEAFPVEQAERTANRQGARRSWAVAGIRPTRVSQRRLAASTNRDRGKSLRTRRGRVRVPRLGGNPHFVGYSAAAHSRANTCALPARLIR